MNLTALKTEKTVVTAAQVAWKLNKINIYL
jgi:hypothetical protein